MFLLQITQQEFEGSIKNLLNDPNIQEAIKDAVKTPQVDGITANQFFIFSLALALSIYLSTISAEEARRLSKENRLGRKDKLWVRRLNLLALFIGDFILWLILLPLVQHVHDFLKDNLPSQPEPIQILGFIRLNTDALGSWIATMIYIATIFMLVMHVVQWMKYCYVALIQSSSNVLIYRDDFSTLLQQFPATLNANDLRVYIALTTLDMSDNHTVTMTTQLKTELQTRTGLGEPEINTALANLVGGNVLTQQGTVYQMVIP